MQILSKLKEQSDTIVKLLPLFAFVVPLALLFGLNPADPYLNLSAQDSFQLMWKGRTFELFFIWLIALEFILNWEIFKSKISKQNKAKLAAVAIALLLPTIYVISEYYFGLNAAIANFSLQNGVAFYDSMPLAIEYLAFLSSFLLNYFPVFWEKGFSRLCFTCFVCRFSRSYIHYR